MRYINVNTKDDLKHLQDKIFDDSFFTNNAEFLFDSSLKIYGYYVDDNNQIMFIEFGKTVYREEVKAGSGIFSKLKIYGSSKYYHGLMSSQGEILIPNNFTYISPIDYGDLCFIVARGEKYGLIDSKCMWLAPIGYDLIFDAREATLGFVKDGHLGFMDINGKVVIEPKYIYENLDYSFNNGTILVAQELETGNYQFYIDHYGNQLTKGEEVIDGNVTDNTPESIPEHSMGTGYYPDGELPSSSDAFEGNDSNRWNTD